MSTLKTINLKHPDGTANTIQMNSSSDLIINGAGSGNVGIGTSSPTTGGLHIAGDYASNKSDITLQNTNGGRTYRIGDGVGGHVGKLVFFDGTASADRMVIDSSGNVGIGTSSPGMPLDVTKAGGGNFVARFQNTTSATPYGVTIRDASSTTNNYPLFQVANSAGSAEYFRVNSGTGIVTMPYQPAFLVRASSSFTGDGSVGGDELFGYTNALVNVGSHFNTTTKTFTAPVNGNYAVNWWASAATVNDNARYIRLRLNKNGSVYLNPHNTISDETNNADYNLVGGSAIVPLSSGDTINVTWGSSIASSEITFYQDMCFFSGYLIG